MKTERYFGACLSIVFLLAGAYVLRESVRNSEHYAEEGVLAGALLFAFAFVLMSWSIKVHLGVKALERHMRGR
jgi:hypothetical protein